MPLTHSDLLVTLVNCHVLCFRPVLDDPLHHIIPDLIGGHSGNSLLQALTFYPADLRAYGGLVGPTYSPEARANNSRRKCVNSKPVKSPVECGHERCEMCLPARREDIRDDVNTSE
jgi:hypothetical protein